MTSIEGVCIGGMALLLCAGIIGMASGAKEMAQAHSEMTQALTRPADRMAMIDAMAQAERERRQELAQPRVAQ